jgi:DNA polymerase sigma
LAHRPNSQTLNEENTNWVGEWVVDHSGASVLIALINHFHQRSRLDRLVDTQAADE